MVAVLEQAMLNSHPVIDAFAYRRTRKKNKDRAAHQGGVEASEGEGGGDGEDIPGGGQPLLPRFGDLFGTMK